MASENDGFAVLGRTALSPLFGTIDTVCRIPGFLFLLPSSRTTLVTKVSQGMHSVPMVGIGLLLKCCLRGKASDVEPQKETRTVPQADR
ncbi:hypothetical protein Poly51_06140 [Rubripirellula tenax]|uniref:Uncharacterized protein n=1 Tax=Rubripirellula tenax TaxID=2528015 RepID=A0A5C6FJV7_9BACT|nr:hypothetical protein Poly51_06140 [Rubripirellula tenax]